ncbi:acyloxyacyl hydrolase [Spirosoma soli]|uniref:Acyloxyacyl hydrolase n=1 Tax=Spirosoma soli TaxID=1770529 RepID=A0ABW5M2M3_9BACT
MNAVLLLSYLLLMPEDSVRRQFGVQTQAGFIIPHAPDLQAVSQSRPVGIELTYSRTSLHRTAYERCNCFARVGAYVNYFTFNNPAELGQTIGAGAFFEPLIRYRKPLYFSLRATAGLTYLTRVYDAESNPRNTFYSAPLSGLLALSAGVHYRVTSRIHLSATANYNHISNGGTRQPNRGMNFPTAGIGLTYTPGSMSFPDPRRWARPRLERHFTKRLMAFGSIRTLPEVDNFPERAEWLWGVTATAGYRLSRFHAFTGGLEFVDDRYRREQLRRENSTSDYRELALLGGYELWLGRYIFTIHAGWNVYQPNELLEGRIFQRYQLLYSFPKRFLVGVGLKSKLNVAEGFDVRMGMEF